MTISCFCPGNSGKGLWSAGSILWLQDWCHSQGFGYLDHGICFEKPGLLEAGGVHLSEKGKSIFGHSLAKLGKRVLK